MRIRQTLFVVLLLTATFSSCDVINPEEDIPAYVHISDFDLSTTTQQGSDSHKITDVTVYANGDILGVFPLPNVVPILSEGQTEIILFPGIKQNGIQTTPWTYNFYERVEKTLNLVPDMDHQIDPSTVYKSNAQFAFLEGFELGNGFEVDIDGNMGTFLERITDGGFEGKAGRMALDTVNNLIIVASNLVIDELPVDGSDVFLEMNYKSDINMSVGLIGQLSGGGTASETIITLFPKEEWNKIYISLSEILVLSQLDGYQLAFTAVLPIENGVFAVDYAELFIDNLKIVHF